MKNYNCMTHYYDYIDLLVIRISFWITGATAVVQVEDTSLLSENFDETDEAEIEIMSEPVEGQDIRYKGSINIFSKKLLENLLEKIVSCYLILNLFLCVLLKTYWLRHREGQFNFKCTRENWSNGNGTFSSLWCK